MRKKVLVVSIIFTILIIPLARTYAQDSGGPYEITNKDMLSGQNLQKEAEIRNFLWEHWSQRRPGSLVETKYSKEGVPTTMKFVLEADRGGLWGMRVHLHRPPARGAEAEYDDKKYTVYSMRRTEPYRGRESAVVFIPDETKLPGTAYRLVFYDQQGKEVGGA